MENISGIIKFVAASGKRQNSILNSRQNITSKPRLHRDIIQPILKLDRRKMIIPGGLYVNSWGRVKIELFTQYRGEGSGTVIFAHSGGFCYGIY